MTTKKNSCKYA